MRVFTYSEAQRALAELLEQAQRDGAVRICGNNGQVFIVRPEQATGSPLDVEGVDLNLSRDEIVEFVHEGRSGT